MRKKSNLKETVIYIFTNWKIYFFTVVQVLLINDVLKNPCGVCALYLTNWSRLPGVLKALILYYDRKSHSICKKLLKQIDCILIIFVMWNTFLFLVDQHGRNQISNFYHESPMTTNVVVNVCMNWNIRSRVIPDERTSTLALIGRDYQSVLRLLITS